MYKRQDSDSCIAVGPGLGVCIMRTNRVLVLDCVVPFEVS